MRLKADMVGQLNLHRALHQPLGQLRQNPARARDLLSLLAPANSSSSSSSETHGRQACSELEGAAAAHSPIYRRLHHPAGGRAALALASSSLRASPSNASANPSPRSARASCSLLLLSW